MNNNMKNMIVLKNLPSNLIEEAIIILKANQKIRKKKFIPKDVPSNLNEKENEYIVKEAEFIISEYIANMLDDKKNKNIKFDKKYKRMRTATFILAIICWIELVCLLA